MATIWPWQWDAYIAAVGAGRGAGDPAWLAGRMLARLDELSLYDPSSIGPDYGGGFLDVPARFTAAELAEAAGAARRCWPRPPGWSACCTRPATRMRAGRRTGPRTWSG